MKSQITFSEREIQLQNEIKSIYNSGNFKLAVQKAVKFLEEHPHSFMARYEFAVIHGDYSYSVELSEDERRELRSIGNDGIKSLFEDPLLKVCPEDFQFTVRNEYYWFFEMPEEQYKLGLEKLALGKPGDYSASVGASMMALKTLKQGNLVLSEDWAFKSLAHFKKFEERAPHWYNINFFAAQALACLGKYDEALHTFKDMFRKQQGPVNELEVQEFKLKVISIRQIRDSLGKN